MRELEIGGVNRSKRVRTSRPGAGGVRHPDLVDRQFHADGPHQLWATDLTFVPTWSGVTYVCSITDVWTVVGWRCASNMRTSMVLDALEVARWPRSTSKVSCVTRTRAVHTRCCAKANAPRSSARCRPSNPSATRTATLWPRRSTASTRPS